MKEIFEENNFRYGVESFLIMYLNKYQFVLSSDLEDYSKRQNFFNEETPCNIYFILKRPKVTINPKSIKIDGINATLDFVIHSKGERIINKISFEFKKVKSELKFHTEYPYNLFCFSIEYFFPSGAHGPGLSFFLILLLLPLSIALFIYDCFNYFNRDKTNLKPIFTHILIWILLLVIKLILINIY